MSILQLKDANKTYGEGHKKVEAMKNTNFVAEQGELIAIIGPSGSGKSTFLTIAGGLQSPSEGSVFINGHDFTNMKEKQRAATRLQEVGFILQASNLVPFLTVAEQLTLSDKVKKDNMNAAERDRLLTELDITDLLKKIPF
ncbi:ABC transporter ATP-binding protein [Brochothrix campestris FSL F6-1037]|uniref:ABC transporter ATP-binding protein n=1 Tax=Brochothrix campestris FSL F6-1037 TaxID=1265861 RepID=W7CM01_9LIST|nr:ABC transporter ATP-binding protein [Brochothrix campestris FSL F6-1037]